MRAVCSSAVLCDPLDGRIGAPEEHQYDHLGSQIVLLRSINVTIYDHKRCSGGAPFVVTE